MIVKCPKNIILEVPEKARVIPCPKNCPRRDTCEISQFLGKKTRGVAQVKVTQEDINNFLNKATSQVEENKVTETPTNTTVEQPTDNNSTAVSKHVETNINNTPTPTIDNVNPSPSNIASRYSFDDKQTSDVTTSSQSNNSDNIASRYSFNDESTNNTTQTSTSNPSNSSISSRYSFDDDASKASQSIDNKATSGNEYIELENSTKPIIYIGTDYYYAYKYAKSNGLPNIDEANIQLFRHWNTDVVFEKGKIAPYYIDVLKIMFKDKYKDVVYDVESYDGDINGKFYRLFYHNVFKGNKYLVSKFFFGDGLKMDYIRSLCDDERDLYDRIYSDNEYLRYFTKCSKELLDYLGDNDSSSSITSFQSVKNRCVKYLNQRYKIVSHFVNDFDYNMTSYYRLKILSKNSFEFINSLGKIDDLDKMIDKIELLKEYEIRSTGEMVDRSSSFICPPITGKVDDSIYNLLGINKINSSQCKDYLQAYLALIKEYIAIARPEEVWFGKFKFTVKNFYLELLDLINRAYAKCTDKRFENKPSIDQSNLYLAYTLYANGVLTYFIDRCNTDKIHILLALLQPTINYETYINSKIEQKYVFNEDKYITTYDYIDKLINEESPEQLFTILNNDLVFSTITGNINVDSDYEDAINRIAKEVKKI